MNPIIWKALDRGWIPDFFIRRGIRSLLAERLAEGYAGGIEKQRESLQQLVADLNLSVVAVATQDANEQHYEVPAGFYKLALGKNLKYSCALYPQGDESLDQAEDLMLALTMQRAQLQDGQTILELGCGWGSLTLAMAAKFPHAQITAVSNSSTQREYILDEARKRQLENVHVITQDINQLELSETFDRIVSVEMFEHVRNYRALFRKCSQWLKPDAKMFVHIFAHRELAYPFEVKDDKDWMAKNFFTGGMMPSEDLFYHFQEDLRILHHWRVNGRHYGQTSEHWLQKADSNRDACIQVFMDSYKESKSDASARFERWRIFFMACAELWNYAKGEEWIVSHYLMEKRSLA